LSEFKFNFTEFLFQLLFKYIALATAIHEYGHLLALRILGYEGVIKSTALNHVYPSSLAGITQLERHFFYIAGGWIQAFVFLFLCIGNKDREQRMINKMIALEGFIYGVFEAFTGPGWWQVGATVGMIAATVFMTLALITMYNPDQ
jgi:hypothetical protein